ncbi:hypothetical protein RB653_000105 [Dictyostelium firmibasis]|uniref:EGF-like domain-containing protein n=1 Tax=Dictyostelium firmibasis TaxID=79012 RepID=A0AAN7U1S6_9MYCE
MVKKIILLFVSIFFSCFVYVSSSSSSSSSSSGCVQKIYSVSEVNPYVLGSVLVIKGIFCLNTTDEIKISLYVPEENSNISYGIDCDDSLMIDSIGETITCRLSDIYQGSNGVNFTSLTIAVVNTPIPVPNPSKSLSSSLIGNSPVPVLGTRSYLFTNSTCPSGCEKNGFCDVASTCRCDQGYASFDCSVKVDNSTSLPSPSSLHFDTFTISTSGDAFNIRLSHILANPQESMSDLSYQRQLSTLTAYNKSSNQQGLSYTLNGTSISSMKPWLNQLYYNVEFNSNNEPSFNYSNYKGSYLPLSSTAAIITVNPTIDPKYLPSQFSAYNGHTGYSMVFEISNLFNNMDGYSSVLSQSLTTITLTGSHAQKSLLVISISDIYSFNQSTVPNHAYIQLLSSSDAETLIGVTSNQNLYVSVVIPQTTSYNPIPKGAYTVQLNINAYNVDYQSLFNLGLPHWAIALIVCGSVLFVVIIIVIVIKCIRSRHHYTVINDPHHHNHH